MIDQDRLSQLLAAARGGPVLILTHDSPDPDALASGMALAALLRFSAGIHSRLCYSGVVGRAENRAMLSFLAAEWEYVETLPDLSQYSALALVDTQPRAGNNRLPDETQVQIVIDHHYPVRDGLDVVPFVDVRPEVGSTVSMVNQYLEAAGYEPEAVLATAMFYGIQADTMGLSRGYSPLDRSTYLKLLQLIDRPLLAKVEYAGLPREYFRAFSNGLNSAYIYGKVVIAYLGAIHRSDFVAEMADLLIRLEGTRAVLCLGHHTGMISLSLRVTPEEQDAAHLIQKIILPPGKAGGHGVGAGGQVPLEGRDADNLARIIQQNFLEQMGEHAPGEPLLL